MNAPWSLHFPLVLALVFTSLAGGCGTLSSDLVAAENAYEEAKYDEAEVWLADIGMDVAKLDPEHRARFYYVRGMTAYRLGRRNDAMHYLALAREEAGQAESSRLTQEKRQIMERTLTELIPHTGTHYANEAGGAADANGDSAEDEAPSEE